MYLTCQLMVGTFRQSAVDSLIDSLRFVKVAPEMRWIGAYHELS